WRPPRTALPACAPRAAEAAGFFPGSVRPNSRPRGLAPVGQSQPCRTPEWALVRCSPVLLHDPPRPLVASYRPRTPRQHELRHVQPGGCLSQDRGEQWYVLTSLRRQHRLLLDEEKDEIGLI